MSLTMGKLFDRNYNLRISFLDGFYNIGIFFNKKSPFMLFNVDPDFSNSSKNNISTKVNMFKNLEASTFCESFLKLYTFKNNTLDIVNQFHKIKSEVSSDIIFAFNEATTLGKTELSDRELFDTITVYGFTIVSYVNEFLFILAERQNIKSDIGKKVVRTTGMQITTNNAIEMMNTHRNELIEHKNLKQNMQSDEKELNFNIEDLKDSSEDQ